MFEQAFRNIDDIRSGFPRLAKSVVSRLSRTPLPGI